MIVLATDAPLSSHNLERLARRSTLALGRVGSFVSDGSGDFVIAFSTSRRIVYDSSAQVDSARELRNDAMSPLSLATVEAVEAAILDSLLQATTVTGQAGRTVEALPIDRLRALLLSFSLDGLLPPMSRVPMRGSESDED